MKKALTVIGATGVGAGLMYLFDPDRGKRRRAIARDRAMHLSNVVRRELTQTSHDLSNRVHGALTEARSMLEGPEFVSDNKLAERVRAKLGRYVSHPRALTTMAEDGWVIVEGPVFADEADQLLKHLSLVKGVKAIEDRLERHGRDERIPELQNGRRRNENSARLSPATRILAMIAGGAMALYGSRKSGLASNALTTVGVGLLGCGVAGRPAPRGRNGNDATKEEIRNTNTGEKTMKVREVMTKDPSCCVPRASLEEVAHLMTELDCGAVPIVDNLLTRKPVGMITDRDIVINTLARGKNPLHMVAEEIMSFPPITVSPEMTVEECCEKMEKDQIRRMMVVDENGTCCGIVAQADIAQKAPRYEVAELVKDVSAHRAAA